MNIKYLALASLVSLSISAMEKESEIKAEVKKENPQKNESLETKNDAANAGKITAVASATKVREKRKSRVRGNQQEVFIMLHHG